MVCLYPQTTSSQSDWPCTDCTCTPGSCCLSGCQPASLFLCRWMFLGQVWTMRPLSPSRLTYFSASLKWQSWWWGKHQEEDKKPEINLKGSDAFGCIQNAEQSGLKERRDELKTLEMDDSRMTSSNYPLKTIMNYITLKLFSLCCMFPNQYYFLNISKPLSTVQSCPTQQACNHS